MTKSVRVAARIGECLDADLVKVATTLKRPKSWVIEQALHAYVESERHFIEAVEEGLADIRMGRVVPHEQVKSEMEAILARHQQ